MHIHICIYTCTCTYTYMYSYAHTCIHTYTCIHVHIHMHPFTHMYSYALTHTYASIHTCLHTHVFIHTHAPVHTCTYVFTHICIHTHVHAVSCFSHCCLTVTSAWNVLLPPPRQSPLPLMPSLNQLLSSLSHKSSNILLSSHLLGCIIKYLCVPLSSGLCVPNINFLSYSHHSQKCT